MFKRRREKQNEEAEADTVAQIYNIENKMKVNFIEKESNHSSAEYK